MDKIINKKIERDNFPNIEDIDSEGDYKYSACQPVILVSEGPQY